MLGYGVFMIICVSLLHVGGRVIGNDVFDVLTAAERQRRADVLFQSISSYETIIPHVVDEHGDFLSYNVHQSRVRRAARGRVEATSQSEIIDGSDISEYRIFYKFLVFGKEFHFDLTLNTDFLAPGFVVEYQDRRGVIGTSGTVANCYYVGQSRTPIISTAAISNCNGLHGVFSTAEEDYFVEPLWNHTNTVETEGHPHVVYKRSSVISPGLDAHCGVSDRTRDAVVPKPLLASDIGVQWAEGHRIENFIFSAQNDSITHRLVPRKVYDIPVTQIKKPFIEKPPYQATDSVRNLRGLLRGPVRQRRGADPRGSTRDPGRQRREVVMEMPERTVETMVVVDREMYMFHKSASVIEPYVLTIMNIVAKLYRDPSIGNSINIVVSKLVILTEDKENLSISHHADRSLDSFCKWQHRQNTTSAQTHDNAVLLTRYDICTYKDKPCGTLGLAPVAGMCEGERSCNINEDIGLASAFTVAHEMGHNFGMQHDGAGNLCGTPGQEPARIMAARLAGDTNPFLWSNCSRQYITEFLESGKGRCLESMSGSHHQADEPVTGYNLGHDANKQCRLQFHDKSVPCRVYEMCRELWCLDAEAQCITNSIPAAEGTACINDTHHFHGACYRGNCVKSDFPPEVVDGGWSAWSGFSECSRTCGGGVMNRQRACNNPKPENGGKYCVGEKIRYKSCNMKQKCADGAVDFRKMQCSEYNTIPFRGRSFNWIPFTGSHGSPCALNCMAEGFNFYTERANKVVDGTPCYPDTLDMCINGECHHVGCDGELGSAAKEDKCRVCAGDGSTCHTISGMVDKSLPKGAYQEILKIPSGAMHIQIQEAYESHNYLALKSEDGPFYINGDWTIDWPRKFTIAGTVFHYERQNDAPEIMRAVGPTSENLVVMLLMQEDNQGVQYEYNVPYSASTGNVTQHTWTHSSWTECSHSCGKGISRSEAVCVHKYRRTIVEDGHCFPQPKPSHHYKHCNQEPCPSDWDVGEWSRCSQTCGGGMKTRTVLCLQRISQEEVVTLDASECPGEQPPSERQCKRSNCPSMWVAEDWTECSKRCGRGEMVRHVYCMTSDREMYLDDAECEAAKKPATIATCVKMACQQPKWVVQDWSECQGRCGEGWQRRQVDCIDHDGEPGDKCDPESRPADARRCDMNCEEELATHDECVDNYNFAYCPLVLKFRFCDREYFLKMCCKTCQISGALTPQ